jgi:hypothetical protein
MILILDDNPARVEAFRETLTALTPAPMFEIYQTAERFISDLPVTLPLAQLISLEHDLNSGGTDDPDSGNGLDVTTELVKSNPACSVILHTENHDGCRAMAQALQDGGWSVERIAPVSGGASWIPTVWLPKALDLLPFST